MRAANRPQGGAIFNKQKDFSILLSGTNSPQETYTITFDTKIPDITGIRLEVLPDKSLPAQGPGRAPNGNSQAPGTHTRSTSSDATPCRTSASIAPSASLLVM